MTTTKTVTTATLNQLCDAREHEAAAEADRRAGGPEYRAALAPDIAAARERLAGLRALAAEGAVATLQAALPTFSHRPAFDHSRRATECAVRAREDVGRALEWLREDEALIERVEHPTVSELKTWELNAYIRVQREALGQIVSPESVRAVLESLPSKAEELRELVSAPMTYRAPGAPHGDFRPPTPARALSPLLDDEDA